MAGKNDYPLSLTIKAIDNASKPLKDIGRSITELSRATGLTGLAHSIKGVGEGLKGVADQALALGTKFAAMGVGAGFALYEFVKTSVDAGAELGRTSKRLDLAVDDFAQLRFAAEQAGVSQDEFTSSLDKLNKGLGEAKAGTGPLLGLLEKAGPVFGNQIKHAKNVKEALGLLSNAFVVLKSPTERAALQQAAFGRGSKEMADFLATGSDAIHVLGAEYMATAGSQKEFAAKSIEIARVMGLTDAAFSGTKNAIALALYPALTKLSKAATDFLVKNRDGITKWANEAGAAIEKWIDGGGIDRLIQGFKDFGDAVKLTVDKVGGLKNAALIVAGIMAGPLIAAVVNLTGAVGTLAARMAFVTFGPWIAAIVQVIPLIGSMEDAWAAFDLVLNANPIGAAVLAIGGLIAVGVAIKNNWTPIKEMFQDIWELIKNVTLAMMGFEHGKFKNPFSGEYNASPAFRGLPPEQMRNYVAPSTGATPQDAAPSLLRLGGSQDSAKVQVDFVGLPKGTRVTPDSSNTADVDLSLGYAGVAL